MILFFFADDTTLSYVKTNFVDLIHNFIGSMVQLLDWCSFNKLDINWGKTKAMFITKKHHIKNEIPKKIIFLGNEIEVVNTFTLLGVIIDDNLSFSNHVSNIRLKVNKRLYAIQKLFFLPKKVKTQFFKTFIMPLFDYCLSLVVYFSKHALQKLYDAYNYCLFKLFKIQIHKLDYRNVAEFNKLNCKLEFKFGFSDLLHRILIKLCLFVHKIINLHNSPVELRNLFVKNDQLNKCYPLRNINNYVMPKISSLNNYGEVTFLYTFTKILNTFCINDINLHYDFFSSRIKNNVNILFDKFFLTLPKFHLTFKSFEYLLLNRN